MLHGPIRKGIFPYIRPLPPTPNFPFIIYPTQIVWKWISVSYNFPRQFPRVRFEEDTYA